MLLATTCGQRNRSLCPHNSLGLQGEFGMCWLAASLLLLLRQPVQIFSDCPVGCVHCSCNALCAWGGLCSLVWALLMRQMSHKGTGDEFPFLVHATREPKSANLLSVHWEGKLASFLRDLNLGFHLSGILYGMKGRSWLTVKHELAKCSAWQEQP